MMEWQEIADNGFSRRVLRDICPTVAATWRRYGQHSALLWPSYLFVSLDGVQLILDTLRETFDTAIRSGASELDPSR